MKKSSLSAGLRAAAEQRNQQVASGSNATRSRGKTAPATVLIGGHFPPEVRRVLLLVQAEPENTGKDLKQLLGEAINDLCAKYRKPQPFASS